MDSVQAFLFDMDGLLLDTEQAFLDAALELLVPRGWDASAVTAFFLSLVGSSEAVTTERLRAFMGSEAEAAAFNTEWRALHKKRLAAHVPLRPTVRETLEQLAARGARMAVVTSTYGAPARHHLSVAGLLPLFEAVVAGDEVTANKPDPAPYLLAAQMLGVDARHCAAFEDSDRGIASAVAAGCMATQIPDLRPPDTPLPALGQRVAQDLASAVAAFV